MVNRHESPPLLEHDSSMAHDDGRKLIVFYTPGIESLTVLEWRIPVVSTGVAHG